MIRNIKKLEPLTEAEVGRIRDVYIPLSHDDDGRRYALNLQSAIAYTGTPMARRLFVPESQALMGELLTIAEQVDRNLQAGVSRFRVDTPTASYRAQTGNNANGPDLQLRVLASEVPFLKELHMQPAWRSLLMGESLFSGGLVLITAPHGQGKTTTASSMVASRLDAYGGMANTYEEPVELPLHGVWGQGGLCIQREVCRAPGGTQSLGAALQDSLRQYPAMDDSTILFIGEIMDGAAAIEALKAAANGHLVIATMHGRGIEAALRRMMLLCSMEHEGSREESLRSLLSEVLRGVFHQRLVWTLGGTGWSAAEVEGQVAWSESPDSELATAIRAWEHDRLSHVLAAQHEHLSGDPDAFLAARGVRAHQGQA